MKKTLKKYFISHKHNNYHAHLLHTKRAIFYSLVFLLTKGILVAFVLFLPVGVFVLPDVLAEEQKKIMALTNQIREDKQVPVLAVADKLNLSAQNKAEDMAAKNYFAHSSGGKSLADWLREANYSYTAAGENLAVGFSSAEDIVAAWQKSPTHYRNLIDTDFTDIGIGLAGGIYKGQPTVFITQHFAAPMTAPKVEVSKPVARRSSVAEVKEVKREIPASVATVASSTNETTTLVLAGKINNDEETVPVIGTNQQTPMAKYMQAKRVLFPLTNIFQVSKNIYLAAMIFFATVLLLNIIVHIRKQQYHIIAQTSGLVALLFIFWKF